MIIISSLSGALDNMYRRYEYGIKIGSVVVEIQEISNGDLVVLVKTHLCGARLSWPPTHDRVS